MTKTINTHGERGFNPERYEFEDWFDATPDYPQDEWANKERAFFVNMLMERSSSVFSKLGSCAHCGTNIRYHVIYRDTRDGSVIAVGETCAAERMGRSKSEWAAKKAKLDAHREAARNGEKFIAIRETFPVAGQLMTECLDEAAECGGYSDEFKARFPSFVLDISLKAKRYGSISPAQADAVEKWVPLHREKVAKRAAEKAAEEANAKPLPEGKLLVEGEIVRAYWYDNGYDGVMKMIVRGDGWKVWGTLPASIERLVDNVDELAGRQVRFSATVTRSDNDESFGFFKRPSKAELAELAEANAKLAALGQCSVKEVSA